MNNLTEGEEQVVKSKQDAINVKIERVGDHWLVSFRYKEYLIYHSVQEILDAIEKEIGEDNPYPLDGTKDLSDSTGFDAMTKEQKESTDSAMTRMREKHVATLGKDPGEEEK